ncbi:hypothetical protein HY995_04225 [Candidatus Micrarchaeota archaeon]|nr:hypothetical protein [Candidatus Micrarchaeota archaeon]MBI5177262.1 hypothetical protein [Candidatus Micrarchaeota archaeon]
MAFQSSKAGKVYSVLILRSGKVVSTDEIKDACKLLGVDFKTALAGLSRAGVLEPVLFKGVYYVRSPEERQLNTIQEDALDVVAKACNLKLKDNWYFGLAAALELAGLSEQQHLSTLTVIAKKRVKRYRTAFGGLVFEFKRLSGVPFNKLVRKEGAKRFSEPARTLADYAYFNARSKAGGYSRVILPEVYSKTRDRDKLLRQLISLAGKYPKWYAVLMKEAFERLRK